MSTGTRFAGLLVAAGVGAGVAALFGLTGVANTPGYGLAVTVLLGFGLYSSTYGIPIAELRSHLRTILLAVTVGVVIKAAIVIGVMSWVFRNPDYVVLGIVVAQIDPLAVAALRARSRLSESAKTLLATWSSFDDPVTVLLTVYVTAFVLGARDGGSGGQLLSAGLGDFGLNLLWNLLLAGGVYVAWRAARAVRRRRGCGPLGPVSRMLLLLATLAVGALAVQFTLLFALALIGLFVRPELGRWLDGMTSVALLMATFAVGLVLVGGIQPLQAVVLGAAAYAAQIVVALLLTIRRTWRGDRARLALAQQNGMTAIILALLLEPNFPGTIAIVAPAIVVVNVLHAVCNGLWNRLYPPPPPEPPEIPAIPPFRARLAPDARRPVPAEG